LANFDFSPSPRTAISHFRRLSIKLLRSIRHDAMKHVRRKKARPFQTINRIITQKKLGSLELDEVLGLGLLYTEDVEAI
jgi:hypothetical protein